MESEMLNKQSATIVRGAIMNALSNIRFGERNLSGTRDCGQIHHCWHVDYTLYFPEVLRKYTCRQINATGIMWALLSQCFTISDINLFCNACTHVWNRNTSAVQNAWLTRSSCMACLLFLGLKSDKPSMSSDAAGLASYFCWHFTTLQFLFFLSLPWLGWSVLQFDKHFWMSDL